MLKYKKKVQEVTYTEKKMLHKHTVTPVPSTCCHEILVIWRTLAYLPAGWLGATGV